MFCPIGYVSLAELWKEFLDKFQGRISAIAREKYCVDTDILMDEFGSPMDFCEDVFLKLVDGRSVFAAGENGNVMRLESSLDGGRSRLFRKMTVLESTLAARDPNEAGPENYWLKKMGSDSFTPWPNTMGPSAAWGDKYPILNRRAESPAKAQFHTLPIAFERERFTIPDKSPPWAIDVIDEHYLPKIIEAFGGYALCLNSGGAKYWRAKHVSTSNFLEELKPSPNSADFGGRPRKQESALAYYRQLFPTGHSGTRRLACEEIKSEFGLNVAPKTLSRAIKVLRVIVKSGV